MSVSESDILRHAEPDLVVLGEAVVVEDGESQRLVNGVCVGQVLLESVVVLGLVGGHAGVVEPSGPVDVDSRFARGRGRPTGASCSRSNRRGTAR